MEKNIDSSSKNLVPIMLTKYTGACNGKSSTPKYVELKVLPCKQKINPLQLKSVEKNTSDTHKCALITPPSQSTLLQSSRDKTLMDSAAVASLGKTYSEQNGLSVSVKGTPDVTSQKLHYTYSSSTVGRRPDKILTPKENFTSIDEESNNQLISPSSRWLSQPRSYRGAKKDLTTQRKLLRKVPCFVDTTDGETSGMGSSVDEPFESSTESASEASSSFLQPRLASRPLATSPSALKQKRRGGWPKGRKRKPELPGTKPPKAPLTGYVLFLNERRKFYKETQGHLPFGEVTKLLGAEWSSMTGEQKAVYLNRSEQERRRYRNELQSYRQSHDYQLQLRKKRIKNVIIPRGATTTEESSDFTDEIDDDDSEELYCRTCDQWFSSLHNKREHLYGKHHLQGIMSEYQRERAAEEMRQAETSSSRDQASNPKGEEESVVGGERMDGGVVEDENEALCKEHPAAAVESYFKYECLSSRESLGVASTTEDDHEDYDDDDDEEEEDEDEEEEEEEDEEREYDGEEEEEEDGGGRNVYPHFDAERVTDAAESVITRVLGREKEIQFLRRRYDKARLASRKLSASLMVILARHQKLQEEQIRLAAEEKDLLEKTRNLEKMISIVSASGDEEDPGIDRQSLFSSTGTEDAVPQTANPLDPLVPLMGKRATSEEIGSSSVESCSSKDHLNESEKPDYDSWIKSFVNPYSRPNSPSIGSEDLRQATIKAENKGCIVSSADAEEKPPITYRPDHHLHEEHSYSRLSHPSNSWRKNHKKRTILEPVMKKVVEEWPDYLDNGILLSLSRRMSDSTVENESLNEVIVTQMAKNHIDEVDAPPSPSWDLTDCSLSERHQNLAQTSLADNLDIGYTGISNKTYETGERPNIDSGDSTNSSVIDTNNYYRSSNSNNVGDLKFLTSLEVKSTAGASDEQGESSNFSLGNLIQEDVYFRQLNLPLDAIGFPDFQNDLRADWASESIVSGRPPRHFCSQYSHVPALDNILEDDDLLKLLENDT